MTQERANEIFDTSLGMQLLSIYVTTDDWVFVRLEEARLHTTDMINGSPTEYVEQL